MSARSALAVCALAALAHPGVAGDPGASAFIDWAARTAHPLVSVEPGHGSSDLEVVKAIIGDARVVGIGESVHATHEFTALQHRIVEFLVEEMGFTAVAVESGLAESEVIHDYVLGADAPANLWESGLASYYAKWQEMRQLVEWLRAYNGDPRHRGKVRFYGVDVPGYYVSWMPAFAVVVAYLDVVDQEYAVGVRNTIGRQIEAVTATGNMRAYEVYGRLPEDQRRELRLALNGLVEHLELHRLDYIGRSSEDEFDWAHRAAVNLRQVEIFYRIAVDRYLDPERPRSGIDPRDWAMAENLAWILDREGPDGRVVVISHNSHIQKLPTRTVSGASATAAMYLQSLVDVDYVAIGTAYGSGARWNGYLGPDISEIDPSRDESIDGMLARVGLPVFLIDLSKANEGGLISQFLERDVETRVDVNYGVTRPGAWDALVFVEEITPAHPAQNP